MSRINQPENAITLLRGVTKTLRLTIQDEDGDPVDLTAATIYFTVKRKIGDELPLFQKISTSPTQAEITDAKGGVAKIYIYPGDTQGRDPGEYVFDIWLVTGTGKQFAVVPPSIFEIEAAVTELR